MDREFTEIDTRLQELEDEIREARKRLPAHSIKPAVMIDLLELEDERDLLLKRRDQTRTKS